MPDFERVFDQLRIDLAKTPEQKARAIGFIEGKAYARKEILWVILFLSGIGGLIAYQFIN